MITLHKLRYSAEGKNLVEVDYDFNNFCASRGIKIDFEFARNVSNIEQH